MGLSNRDRIGKALDELRDGLFPYISINLERNLGSSWYGELPLHQNNLKDIYVLLGLFMSHWKNIFKRLFVGPKSSCAYSLVVR